MSSNQQQQQQLYRNRKFCNTPVTSMDKASAMNTSQQQQQEPYQYPYQQQSNVPKYNMTVTRTYTTTSAPASLVGKVEPIEHLPLTSTQLPCAASKTTTTTTASDAKPKSSSCCTKEVSRNSSKCSHPSHMSVNAVTSMQQISTEHYSRQLQKYKEEAALSGGDTAKMNGQINEIFVKRLQDIDCHAAGDTDLKLITYQEWVDMLLRINEALISNMEDLESEVAERLDLIQRKVGANCRNSQGNELARSRKDICTLMKIIQNAYHGNNWDLQGVQFETLTHAQVLGLNENQKCVPRVEGGAVQSNEDAQHNKLIANMRALALEVADKHDDIRELKRQVLALEDEIQKAQKKIQLKDDVIKELRNDLKNAGAKVDYKSSCAAKVTYADMPPVNLQATQSTSRTVTTQVSDGLASHSNNNLLLYDDNSRYESLSQTEQLENHKLKVLEEELNELFQMAKDLKKQNLESHRRRLSDIFRKSEAEKAQAYRKLDYIRQQLIDLEAFSVENYQGSYNDCDSGFSSKEENDQDAKIIDAVRKRILKLNTCMFNLKTRVQKLEIENSEISTSLETEKTFAERNSKTLKEIADLLCSLNEQQFSYSDIYSNTSEQNNPFCEAILNLKKDSKDYEEDFICDINSRDKKIKELQDEIINYKKNNKKVNNTTSYKIHTATMPHTSTFTTTSTNTTTTKINSRNRMEMQPDIKTQRLSPPSPQQQQQLQQHRALQRPQQQQQRRQISPQTQLVNTTTTLVESDTDDNKDAWNW